MIVSSGATTVTKEIGTDNGYKGVPRWDGGKYLLMTDHLGQSFSKVDVSNIDSPSVKYTESVSGNPEPGIIVNEKAYIPCGYQGLLIEK